MEETKTREQNALPENVPWGQSVHLDAPGEEYAPAPQGYRFCGRGGGLVHRRITRPKEYAPVRQDSKSRMYIGGSGW
jgi:hypothetical protein